MGFETGKPEDKYSFLHFCLRRGFDIRTIFDVKLDDFELNSRISPFVSRFLHCFLSLFRGAYN